MMNCELLGSLSSGVDRELDQQPKDYGSSLGLDTNLLFLWAEPSCIVHSMRTTMNLVTLEGAVD